MRLERLSVPGTITAFLPYIPLLRCLSTLQLSMAEGDQSGLISAFYSSMISAQLPLRHLRVQHQGLFTVIPTFVSAYAAQFLMLDLIHCFHHDEVDQDMYTYPGPPPAASLPQPPLRRLARPNADEAAAVGPE